MRITIKKVSLLNHDGYPNQVRYQLPEDEVHVGRYQERNGEELLSLWLPDGSEVYETVMGETAVKVPDPLFSDGMRLTLAEAAALYEKYIQPVEVPA